LLCGAWKLLVLFYPFFTVSKMGKITQK